MLPVAVVLMVSLLAGCASYTEQPATAAPRFTIQLEAQSRLLQEAEGLMATEQYAAATRTLGRLLATYPSSPHVPEARLLLARCYERQGQLQAAVAQASRSLPRSDGWTNEENFAPSSSERSWESRRAPEGV